MKRARCKVLADGLAMVCLLAAIVTGFMLHSEVWHRHIYDNSLLWGLHEGVGIALLVLLAVHCVQHSFWFKNYSKITADRKRVTTILLLLGVIVAVSGVILMAGSMSETVSHVHYVGAILFVAVAVGHVAKRWKMLKNLCKQL